MNWQWRLALSGISIATAGLVTWLWLKYFNVSWRDFELLQDALNLWTVPIIAILLCGHVALSSLRWARIEVVLGGDPPTFRRAFTAGCMALGLGTVLPGPAANILCRSISNRLDAASPLRGALSGGLDQISDFLLVCCFAPLAIAALAWQEPLLYLAGSLALAPIGWLMLKVIPSVPTKFVPKIIKGRFEHYAKHLDRRTIGELYLYSLARLAMLSLITVLVHFACGGVTVSSALVAVPLVTIAISISMLPGGFGAAEWSFSGVFAGLDIPSNEIALFVLMNRVLLTGLGLFIALVSLLVAFWKSKFPALHHDKARRG